MLGRIHDRKHPSGTWKTGHDQALIRFPQELHHGEHPWWDEVLSCWLVWKRGPGVLLPGATRQSVE